VFFRNVPPSVNDEAQVVFTYSVLHKAFTVLQLNNLHTAPCTYILSKMLQFINNVFYDRIIQKPHLRETISW